MDDNGDDDAVFGHVKPQQSALILTESFDFMSYLPALSGIHYIPQPGLLSGGWLAVLPLFLLKASIENSELPYTVQIPCPCHGTKQLTKHFQRCCLIRCWHLCEGGRSGLISSAGSTPLPCFSSRDSWPFSAVSFQVNRS